MTKCCKKGASDRSVCLFVSLTCLFGCLTCFFDWWFVWLASLFICLFDLFGFLFLCLFVYLTSLFVYLFFYYFSCVSEKELLAEVDSEFIVKLYRTFQVLAKYNNTNTFQVKTVYMIEWKKPILAQNRALKMKFYCDQTEEHLHLLLELCQGGELWARVRDCGHMDDQGLVGLFVFLSHGRPMVS